MTTIVIILIIARLSVFPLSFVWVEEDKKSSDRQRNLQSESIYNFDFKGIRRIGAANVSAFVLSSTLSRNAHIDTLS